MGKSKKKKESERLARKRARIERISMVDDKSFSNDWKKYVGMPPYDDGGNPCLGDGFYIASMVKKYGISFDDMVAKARVLGLKETWDPMSIT